MMTHALTNEAFAALGAPNLVYVRAVKAEDVIAHAPDQAREAIELSPDQILYAVHSANGARLAVMADRDSAYAVARAHELAPVSVH